jgi:O-antigen ligase
MKQFALSVLGLLAASLALASLVVQRDSQTQGATVGLPDPSLDPRPANLFAVNVSLEAATPEKTDRALDMIAEAGFGWVKQNFRWAAIEASRGTYDWEATDRIVGGAAARGLGVVAVLHTTPEWARADHSIDTAPPLEAADFGRFAGALAERYGDDVDVYQIWDEPNLATAWGRPDSAADYLRILKPAYIAIHAADPGATVLLAALAPTSETGPNNLSDILYLRALYLAGAAPYFDAASAKPYGFDYSPDVRATDPNVFNFSRLLLFREEMVRNGDGHKLLWAGNFGWNALPPGWEGEPSLWGQVTEAQQAEYAAAAYARAVAEWPWAGPMALENFQPDPEPPGLNPFGHSPEQDARWGFALVDSAGQPRPVLDAIRLAAQQADGAPPGNHRPDLAQARYEGDWEFSELGADIPQTGPARITLDFVGTDLAVRVRRADYRAYLYVSIDGQPSASLPRDSRGAYLVLTAPDLMPHVDTLTIAQGLPYGRHTAVIEAERGWDQWAIVGYSVGRSLDNSLFYSGLGLAGLLVVVFGLSAIRNARRADMERIWAGLSLRFDGLTSTARAAIASMTAGLLWLAAWLTWGGELSNVARRLGDSLGGPGVVAAFVTAGLFYLSPWLVLALLSIACLFIIFVLRLDLALALIALFAPFYLQPRPLFDKMFSMVEITTVLAVGAWVVRTILERVGASTGNKGTRGTRGNRGTSLSSLISFSSLSSLDLAVILFIVASLASTFAADIRGVATRELRVIILEPALFYLLLRVTPLDRNSLWRVVDCWMLGAVIVAAIGLYQYATGTNLIAAEAGVMRLRSVYGSPNNVGLFLGRALPVLAAVSLLGRHRWRSLAYGAAALVLLPATILSFSKGALVLGVPASLAVVAIFWGGRRAALALAAAGAAALALALGPLSRIPRFAGLFDLRSGTSFFRVRLWGSAVSMVRDHPLMGVGPDNFLYAYRGHYIHPEAWQEPNLSHAHNVVLDFASRLGLPGLAAFLWMQLAFFRMGLSVAIKSASTTKADIRALAIGLVASMVGFLAHGLVDASYFFVDLAFVYFLTMGLVTRLTSDL